MKEGVISGQIIFRFDRVRVEKMLEAGFEVVICSAYSPQIIEQIPFANHLYVFEYCSTRIYDYFNKFEKLVASGKLKSDLKRRAEIFLGNVSIFSLEYLTIVIDHTHIAQFRCIQGENMRS